MSKKKQPYYPNNWAAIAEAPSEWFDSIPFDEFMEWKMHGWELPSSIACIIREKNYVTGKVKEYTYSQVSAANKKARKIMDEAQSEFLVCTADEVHLMYPTVGEKEEDLYDEPIN
tara:strand:+ start:155 stop:499 length:345 start_codon:yes stop_codon:yes gene_type:complete